MSSRAISRCLSGSISTSAFGLLAQPAMVSAAQATKPTRSVSVFAFAGSGQVGLDNMLCFLMDGAAVASGGLGECFARLGREIRNGQLFADGLRVG